MTFKCCFAMVHGKTMIGIFFMKLMREITARRNCIGLVIIPRISLILEKLFTIHSIIIYKIYIRIMNMSSVVYR